MDMKRKPLPVPSREVIVVQLRKPLTRILISTHIKKAGDNPKRRGALSEFVNNALNFKLGI